MNTEFMINNQIWTIEFTDNSNSKLLRSDGSRTVGMTDGNMRTVYLAESLSGAFLERVLAHELCHCICFSYDISIPIEQEEFLADWVSLYGREVIDVLDNLIGQVLLRKYA